MITSLMLSTTIADAAKRDRDGLKQTNAKSAKANKAVKRKNATALKRKKVTGSKRKKVVSRRAPQNKLVVHTQKRKKKSKSRKVKQILKHTLRALVDNTQINEYNFDRRRRHGVRPDYNYDRALPACLPRYAMRDRLVRRGWVDFELIKRNRDKIRLGATNFKGRRFVLVLDSCSGEVLKRRPVRRYWGGGH